MPPLPIMILDISSVYQKYRKELVNHLLRIVKCPDTAEDLVQESYLILARTSQASKIDYPRGFLYRTAGNLALDYLRHHKIVDQHQQAVVLTEQEPRQADVASEIDRQQWQALLQQTINQLPPRCRDVFIQHKLKGMSYREIAQLQGISESAVEKHIIKGLIHCRQQLGQHYPQP